MKPQIRSQSPFRVSPTRAPMNPVTTGLHVRAHEEPNWRISKPRPTPRPPPRMINITLFFMG